MAEVLLCCYRVARYVFRYIPWRYKISGTAQHYPPAADDGVSGDVAYKFVGQFIQFMSVYNRRLTYVGV